jgi:hypothetical protein
LAVGQIELTWVQNGPVGFGKKYNILKKIYSLRDDNFVSRELQITSRKIGNIVTLSHGELSKNTLSLGGYLFYVVSNPWVKYCMLQGLFSGWYGPCSRLIRTYSAFGKGSVNLRRIKRKRKYNTSAEQELDLPFQQLRFIIETGAQEPHGA